MTDRRRIMNGNKKEQEGKILYITGSFPRLGDGIGDAAGKLYDAIEDKNNIELVTSNSDEIAKYVKEKQYSQVQLVNDWKYRTISNLIKRIIKENIDKVLIEYAGNGYKKDLAISFLPLRIRIHNLFSKEKVQCHLRLHEFSMCRPARKIFTYPLVWFCHHMDTPSYVEYKILSKKYGDKVTKSGIGSNLNWREHDKESDKNSKNKIVLAFFGGIYPGKGIEKLLELWGKLEKENPGIYEYQLLGGFPKGLTNAFDDYQLHVERLIKEQGLDGKITVSGFLPEDEIEKWLDGVDIAVLPYEDGLTLRRGSFLAFLGRQVAVVTSEGDEEAKKMFMDSSGVKMCTSSDEMIKEILALSKDNKYFTAGLDNLKYRDSFDWIKIAEKVIGRF